ncbi:L,D-transpeptidase [Candidatus Daviesbacteria bacterium]|nr:L,D-transpeptidase [Candidatus Daviesbacteria bacterium]
MRIFLIGLLMLFTLIKPIDVQAATKRIEVDLTAQKLHAFEDNTLVYSFLISSGKPWWPTPTGDFKPWVKVPFQRMIGGDKRLGTYYNLPNVPYVVYFYKGYALHGTYWHSNFGVPMSHGCINLKTDDMTILYPWIDYSTQIRIYGVTPAG